jgi:hypothetical protein
MLKPTHNQEASLNRKDFLEKNRRQLADKVKQAISQIDLPFGVLLDLRDWQARQFALALGKTEKEIDDDIRYFEGKKQIPTLTAVIHWQDARMVMPYTSPTAKDTLDALWKICQATGEAAAVAVSDGGNIYTTIEISQPD